MRSLNYFLLLYFGLLTASFANNCDGNTSQSFKNRDGSVLIERIRWINTRERFLEYFLRNQNTQTENKLLSVMFSFTDTIDGEPEVRVIKNTLTQYNLSIEFQDHPAMGTARFEDIDHDGISEIELFHDLGAANGRSDIYKLAPDKKSMFLYFRGGSDIQYRDHFLIVSGKASCCAWQHDVYATSKKNYPITDEEEDALYSVSVANESGSNKNTCTITRLQKFLRAVPNSIKQLCRLPYQEPFILKIR